MSALKGRKKRRLLMRRKRSLDPTIVIDYKNPDVLKRFVSDRGKIIPRRISGATAKQQRMITSSVKKARYLGLIPYTTAHRTEKGFTGEVVYTGPSSYDRMRQNNRPPRTERPETPREGAAEGDKQ